MDSDKDRGHIDARYKGSFYTITFPVFIAFYNLFWAFALNRFCYYQDGIGGSYRLPSLDRLAYKQRLLQENGGLGGGGASNLERNGNGDSHPTAALRATTTTTVTSSATALVRIEGLILCWR